MRGAAISIIAICLTIGMSACAGGTVYSGKLTDYSGKLIQAEPQSSGSEARPADQTKESAHEVVARYNASTGTITFSDEVWDPSFWGEHLPLTSFILKPDCSGRLSGDGLEFSAFVHAAPKKPGPQPSNVLSQTGVTAFALLTGSSHPLHSEGTFNGRRFEVTFKSPAYRNRAWKCAFASTEVVRAGWTFPIATGKTPVRSVG